MQTLITAPEEIKLSNGIPVLLQDYPGHVAATHWFIQTGSADERPNEAGFAHFLEHMLFKDTSAKEMGRASTGRMAQVIEGKGGDLNAYTSFDHTVYHVTCAERYWEEVLEEWSSIAQHQKFLKEDFQREREVILEELRRSLDSPGRVLYEEIFAKSFGKHPYGRPVIGFPRTLNAAKVTDLEAFYQRRYIPSRMGLVLVGPLGEAESPRRKKILSLLEKRFGSKSIPVRPKKDEPRTRFPETVPSWKWVKKGFDVKSPSLIYSFRVPHQKHEDLPVLDLATHILGLGETSRLYQNLFYQRSLVTDVSSFVFSQTDAGVACVYAEMDSLEKVNDVLDESLKEIVRIRDEGVKKEELDRVIAYSESERYYSSQTSDSLASRLGHLRFVLGDLNYDQEYLSQIRQTTSDHLKEVVSRYFTMDRMSGAILLPESQMHADISMFKGFAEKHLKATEPKSSQPAKKKAKSGPTLTTLASGAKLIVLNRPHSPLFSIHASVLGGTRLEEIQGESALFSMTWNKGTLKHDAKSIAELIEGKASSLEGFSGRHSNGLQMTGLSKDWDELSALFSEVLFEPTFREDELEHSKRVSEETIRTVEDHSSQICSKLFMQTLYENHPYGKFPAGTIESVKSVQSDQLRKLHQAWIRPERLVLSVSGNVEDRRFEKWIQGLEERFSTVPKTALSKTVEIAAEKALRAPRWASKTLDREQLHLLVGTLGITMHSKERFAMRALQNILGGQGGRLFLELREKKSLAYTVSPIQFEGIETGHVATYIACSPSKKDEALKGIQAVLSKLAKSGPTKTELTRAKELFLGHRAMELQGDSSLASHYGLQTLYGFTPSDEAVAIKAMEKVTGSEIQKVCKKYFIDPPMVTTVVG